ncbi:polymer-forming cytoskeletal protein [Polynucleobacter sp. AM-7D1]|uniref:bactofilin family protein n=1 Tax=Polynucleobacter sp. AM-7D1 TaxID=2689102 RepID=UPI001BFCFB50|nr:polymer-forming cytoskeletal protein [Polynucleobacter sp. AM-7D1]QWE29077.1 polymer-forming cytoskeletal protein [Polynucleobacter sp. AM-7D1]
MFEFSKKGPMADTQLTYASMVGSGSTVKGNFTHRGNMLLSGHLVGDIHQDEESSGSTDGYTAVVGKSGFLEGNIHSAHAIIIGRIEGSVYAKGRVEIYPGAIVNGDVTYSQINVHPDAKVNGNLKCLLSDLTDHLIDEQGSDESLNNVLPMTKADGY